MAIWRPTATTTATGSPTAEAYGVSLDDGVLWPTRRPTATPSTKGYPTAAPSTKIVFYGRRGDLRQHFRQRRALRWHRRDHRPQGSYRGGFRNGGSFGGESAMVGSN